MKYIDSFDCFESNDPSMEDLNNFFKDLMAGKTQIQQHYKNYKIDINKIRALVKEIVYTPEFIAELTRRKITIPDISKLKMSVEKTTVHRKFLYELSDNLQDPDNIKFNINLVIEIPFDEELESDNTLLTASLWVKRHGRYPELFGYSNKRLQKDDEFNYFSVGSVLQYSYEELMKKVR